MGLFGYTLYFNMCNALAEADIHKRGKPWCEDEDALNEFFIHGLGLNHGDWRTFAENRDVWKAFGGGLCRV